MPQRPTYRGRGGLLGLSRSAEGKAAASGGTPRWRASRCRPEHSSAGLRPEPQSQVPPHRPGPGKESWEQPGGSRPPSRSTPGRSARAMAACLSAGPPVDAVARPTSPRISASAIMHAPRRSGRIAVGTEMRPVLRMALRDRAAGHAKWVRASARPSPADRTVRPRPERSRSGRPCPSSCSEGTSRPRETRASGPQERLRS
jgi:hypothetical protein